MEKIFGEVDSGLDLKILEISGGFFSRKRRLRKSKWDREKENLNKAVLSLTDESTINKIYRLPILKDRQLETALHQKLQRDMEFITPLSSTSWIFSKKKVGDELLVLVSLIDKVKLQPFNRVRALTLTPQVIFNALSGKTKETFMLIHIFNRSAIIFVFHNGHLDYIQSTSATGDITDSIELAKEYYKERKKIDLSNFYFSGDFDVLKDTAFNFKPITKLLENTGNAEFLIPEVLTHTKVPFIVDNRKKRGKEILLVSFTILFISIGTGIHYENVTLSRKILELEKNISTLNRNISSLQEIQRKLQANEKILQNDLNRKDIKELLATRKPEVIALLRELEPILNSSHSYLLYLKKDPKDENSYKMNVITFCRNLSSPVEFNAFVNKFRKIKSCESVKLIYSLKYPALDAIMSNWSLKIKEKPYVDLQ